MPKLTKERRAALEAVRDLRLTERHAPGGHPIYSQDVALRIGKNPGGGFIRFFRQLIDDGLVHRPGDNRGYDLTDAGRAALEDR